MSSSLFSIGLNDLSNINFYFVASSVTMFGIVMFMMSHFEIQEGD